MTQPHHDRAQAALDSLRTARAALARRPAQAMTWARNVPPPASDGLRSPRYGTRTGSGGHGDPTAGILIDGVTRAQLTAVRAARYADQVTDTLNWLARQLGAAGAGDPLDRIEAALPTLTEASCAELVQWLAELECRIRVHLGDLLDEYGTAEQIAARLTTPERTITAERIRDWARRARAAGDRLYGLLPPVRVPGARTGDAWYRVSDARHVLEVTARPGERRRGRKPQVSARVDDRAA
ncbi:hypothetical protein ACQEVZ_20225 [Dactylosporangium sp. CA-152071]|uniref:hypothetical protein n=1 Tax=Dactylosporangium sp. CA-152071 TaxID=3239933 RepID=UPI003D94ACD7